MLFIYPRLILALLFKKNWCKIVKLELLTNANMLMLFEQGIRVGICTAIRYYAEANNKYMKNYDSTKKMYLFNVC